MGVLVCGTHETGRGEAAIGEGGAALDKRDIGMGMGGVVRAMRVRTDEWNTQFWGHTGLLPRAW